MDEGENNYNGSVLVVSGEVILNDIKSIKILICHNKNHICGRT